MSWEFESLLCCNNKQIITHMNDLLLAKKDVGLFCFKMYQANRRSAVEVTLRPEADQIVVYYKDRGHFEYISIVDEDPNLNNLVNMLSHE